MDVRVGLERKLSAEELMLLNCGIQEDTWESLVLQEGPIVHPKEDQSWVFIGRTDAEAETPILWPPESKSWLIWKEPDAWKDWGQEEKGTTEDEMAGWHHRIDGHEFEWTPGGGDGQGGLLCHKESDMTEWLNWSKLNWLVKNPPAMQVVQEMWVWSLGGEEPLEHKMQPSPVFLSGKIHGQRCVECYSLWDGSQRVMTKTHTQYLKIVLMVNWLP